MISRRAFLLMTPPTPFAHKPVSLVPKTVPVSGGGGGGVLEMESDTMYVYRNDRFQALYMVSEYPPGQCVTVRRRVDWYDPISDEPKSTNESVMYITGYDEF